MSEIQEFIDELKKVHDGDDWQPSLREALSGITFEQAAARPVENAHSVWEIVAHIAGWEDVFRRRLQGQKTVAPAGGDFPKPSEINDRTWAEALANLENTHQELLQAASFLDDSTLDRKEAGKDYSHRYLLRKTIEHNVYHAGQISLLKKAFGNAQKLGFH